MYLEDNEICINLTIEHDEKRKGELNMNLKEKAIEVYEKEKELRKESEMREAEKFTEEALKVLRDIIGEGHDNIVTLSKLPGDISFIVDGILFRAGSNNGYPVINVVVKCDVCGSEIINRVVNIKDIGRALAEQHPKYDCDQVLRLKKEMEDRKNGKVLDVNERLVEALRDFVSENMIIE